MQIERRGLNIYQQLEMMLSSGQIGDIASDHRAELQGFNGWNYVAITAVAKQATRSLIYVYDDSDPEKRELRKSLRLEYGHQWRKALVREHQGQVVDAVHPLVKLLKRPNPSQSGGSFRWEQIQQMRLHGSCIVFNRPNVLGNRTVERYVIPMALITPIKPGRFRSMPMGGITINPSSWNSFMVHSQSAEADAWSSMQQFINVQIPVEMLSIIKYPHPHLKGDGASPTNASSRWIDAGSMIDQSQTEFYQEGPNGKILVTVDGMNPVEMADLEDRLSRNLGPDGPRVTVVSNGTAVIAKRTADEMAYKDGHDQMRDGVLAAQGVGKAVVGSADGLTYGSLAASMLAFTMLSVQPDMDLIADAETLDLGPEYGPNISIEYEVLAINDPELEDRRLESDSSKGVMTVGEYRMKRGEPLFGTAYDNYIMTSSGPVSPESLITTKPAPEPETEVSVDQAIPDMPSMEFPEQSFAGGELGKAMRLNDEPGEIMVDETVLDSIDRHVTEVFEGAGYKFKPMMEDDGDEPMNKSLPVWGWQYGSDYLAFAKSLPASARQLQIVKALEVMDEEEATVHKYGCILFTFPDDMTKRFVTEANAIPEKRIAAGGRELEPHVTGLYGILGIDMDDIVRIVAKIESPLVSFGKVASFPGGDDGVPLFVAVDSEDLQNINTQLRSLLPHAVTHPDYTPHATLAYVDTAEGLENKRCSLTGKSCYLGQAIISMPGKDRVVVPLRRPFVQGDLMPLAKPAKSK